MQETIILPKTTNDTTAHTEWQDAIELWLASRNRPATRRAYASALQDLLTSSGRLPWEVTRTDVIRWVQSCKTRGLAPATISNRLAGVSSFYAFVTTDYLVTLADGSQAPLHGANPASGKNLRPRVELYGRAAWLSPNEARALLGAIERDDLMGLRNYAMLLGYIFLARRNSEWRTAKWGDFERHGNLVQFRWSGKGQEEQRQEVPPPVWSALLGFLEAAGRMETIGAGEYVFTALGDTRRPLCAHRVGRILKRYCRLAGLVKSVHPHTLRHTGAMLRQAGGDRPEDIQSWLGHKRMDTTLIYLHKLDGKQDKSWGFVADLLGLPSEAKDYTNGPKTAKNGPITGCYRTPKAKK